jgi:hypothetical protein
MANHLPRFKGLSLTLELGEPLNLRFHLSHRQFGQFDASLISLSDEFHHWMVTVSSH